jgi:transposase InsO family protein
LVGPLPTSKEGFSYILTVVDRTTRWFEAIPLHSITAAAVAESFVAAWVARFGVPATITSDRGVQFTSELWAATMKKLGIKHLMTTAFHPQSNGLVERAHRHLKEALKARLAAADWPSHLPWVLLGLRAAPREDSGVSVAELLYGAALSLPG